MADEFPFPLDAYAAAISLWNKAIFEGPVEVACDRPTQAHEFRKSLYAMRSYYMEHGEDSKLVVMLPELEFACRGKSLFVRRKTSIMGEVLNDALTTPTTET